jgi:hypothetical protein
MIGVVFGVSDHTELHMCVVTNSTKQMMMKYRIAHGRRRKKTPIRPLRLVRHARDGGAQNKRWRPELCPNLIMQVAGPFSGAEKAGPGRMQ